MQGDMCTVFALECMRKALGLASIISFYAVP